MWYEILPSFMILTACLSMTGVVTYAGKYIYNGNVHGRAMNSKILRHYYNRDERIMGRARKVVAGLDGLPAQ